MDEKTKERLLKMLEMTLSEQEGEAHAALRQVQKIMRAHKLRFADIVSLQAQPGTALSQKPATPTPPAPPSPFTDAMRAAQAQQGQQQQFYAYQHYQQAQNAYQNPYTQNFNDMMRNREAQKRGFFGGFF